MERKEECKGAAVARSFLGGNPIDGKVGIMIQRVLLGIGGTPFTGVAIRRAVELCQLHQAQLTAVTVVDQKRLGRVGPVPAGAGASALELREHRLAVTRERIEGAVDSLKQACDEADVPVTILREEGTPFQLMVDYARYHDLSVFGLRSMFEYEVLGGSDIDPAGVLHRMVVGGVRPIVAVSERFRTIRRVLVAYGGSVRAAESMKHFVRMRLWPEVQLRILACDNDTADAEVLLNDASVYCRQHGYEAERVCRSGPPGKEILAEAADWDADLIVMGTNRGSVLSRAVFGSTALEITRNADVPLFLGQ
jgi:nucleotide-binding universal stress UspA family protein